MVAEELINKMNEIEKYRHITCITTLKDVVSQLDSNLKFETMLITKLNNEIEGKVRIKDKLFITQDGVTKIINNDNSIFNAPCVEKIFNNGEDLLFVSDIIKSAFGESYIVIRVNAKTVKKHINLTKNVRIQFKIYPSLIHAVMEETLSECRKNIILFDVEGKLASHRSDTVDIIRRGAKNFIFTFSTAGQYGDGFFGIYELCEEISMLTYESSETRGGFILTDYNNSNIESVLKFDEDIIINSKNYRKIRKLIEITDKSTYLFTNGHKIFGLGRIKQDYDPKDENIFTINFIGHHVWEVCHTYQSLMVVENGYPSLPKEKFLKENFKRTFFNIFGEKQNLDDYNYILKLVNEAIKQKHGTMLVISNMASKESKRLSKQAFVLEEKRLPLDIINQITRIDGALLLSPEGLCYGIGTILDGVAIESSDISRGARYNSALRYYELHKDYKCMIVIISEDGMIDIIPNNY